MSLAGQAAPFLYSVHVRLFARELKKALPVIIDPSILSTVGKDLIDTRCWILHLHIRHYMAANLGLEGKDIGSPASPRNSELPAIRQNLLLAQDGMPKTLRAFLCFLRMTLDRRRLPMLVPQLRAIE